MCLALEWRVACTALNMPRERERRETKRWGERESEREAGGARIAAVSVRKQVMSLRPSSGEQAHTSYRRAL